jgi:hypothetical protein
MWRPPRPCTRGIEANLAISDYDYGSAIGIAYPPAQWALLERALEVHTEDYLFTASNFLASKVPEDLNDRRPLAIQKINAGDASQRSGLIDLWHSDFTHNTRTLLRRAMPART